MAGPRGIQVLVRCLGRGLGHTQAQVVLRCRLEPIGDAGRRRPDQRDLVLERHDAGVARASDLADCHLGGVQRLLGLDHLRDGEVIARLCLLHVGDGRQADLETLLGQLELALDRFLLGVGEAHAVGRAQQVEIGLGHAEGEVLLGDDVVRLRRGGLLARRLPAVPCRGVEQRLAKAEGHVGRVGVRVDVTGAVEVRGVCALVTARRARDQRQQRAARARVGGDGGVARPIGGAQRGVVADRQLVDAGQLVGRGERRHEQGERESATKVGHWSSAGQVFNSLI
jgi:hypothetical protein